MGRRLLVAAILGLGCPCPGMGQTPDAGAIDAWLERVARERDFTGVVLVAEGLETLLERGYGLADESGTLVTADAVIPTGSISKQFTAAAILMLQERGLLRVTDPLSDFFGDVPPDKASITIHQLLTHSGGFGQDHFSHDLTPLSLEEALDTIFRLKLDFTPGDSYAYSNTGYALLAAIIQGVTGRPFVDFMREEVFDAFGLHHTGFFSDDWSRDAVPTAYFNGERQGPPSSFPGPYWGNMGNGGVMSTTRDLFLWVTALRGGEVLGAESLAELFGRHVAVRPNVHYGYGWATNDSTELGLEIGHGGLGIGGNTELSFYPERALTIIVLSNRADYVARDGEVARAWLPARLTRNQLRANLATGDFAPLPAPRPGRTRSTALGLLAVAALVLSVVLFHTRRLSWRRSDDRAAS